MTSAGPTCRSAAIAGSAMFAIAVSSDAIATAVKIAAAAHPRRSAGRPSIAAGPSAETISVDIRKDLQIIPDVVRIRAGEQTARCMPHMRRGIPANARIKCPVAAYAGDCLLYSGEAQRDAEQDRRNDRS